MNRLHWEAVEPEAREAFAMVSRALAGGDYYLAGGTALALMEGHRVSVDLDVFTERIPDSEEVLGLLRRQVPRITVTSVGAGTLYADVLGVQVSVIEYGYRLLGPTVSSNDHLPLAGRDDIAAMKLSAIASRGSRKDFVDLWVLVTRHRSLAEYLALYREKFEERDVGHVVRSLVHFDDAEREAPLRLLIDIDWDELKTDFQRRVADLW
ncbi:MAG: nucleotidyl transferase AbiEii/AbiGii toxin family protein [Holophagales bacterium]|nr:nucleotidyl transferase AbiEii/AbiGii toxin family protein [Holophagales bacterium]MYF05062.1 nucleotidyl transferase AbiEii/AbiGii toxin family protein [Holophagales bacterium]MYJ26153.1 nucleotidyl transferase AbiEii/AbiGii toxin family protein [Holophagales bacterium]